MDRILKWHPRFIHHCHHDLGIFLVSEREALWLAEEDYPGIHLIDGEKGENEIIAAINNFARAPMFIYQLGKLVQKGIFVDQAFTDNFGFYLPQSAHVQYTAECSVGNRSILDLSHASQNKKRIWLQIINSLTLNPHSNAYKNTDNGPKKTPYLDAKITFVLTDDFLDQGIINRLPGHTSYILLKISGDIIWISPIIRHDVKFHLPELQFRLLNNQPVRKLIQQHSNHVINTLPFAQHSDLHDDQILTISNLISQQIDIEVNADRKTMSSKERVIIQFDTYQNDLSQHNIEAFFSTPIPPPEQQNSLSTEKPKTPRLEIQLKPCAKRYDIDGGFRSLTPEETLKNLQALISPITGIINKLEVLDDMENRQIKIYQSAFFKTLTFQNQDHIHSDIHQNDFIQACLGKGVSPVQSQVSALCEAVERHNAQYQGDEQTAYAKQSELSQRNLSHQQLSPYSAAQYQAFHESEAARTQLKRSATSYDDEVIHWYNAWSLSAKAAVYLPFTCCFANTPLNEEKFGRWHSNGAAAGNTLEEAILQALLELIERDAVAIWWYNQIERPEFPKALIDQQRLKLITQDLDQQHDFWLLDITNDVDIPVVAAIARHRQNKGYSMGFGCHLQPGLAAQRALTELCQLIPIRDQKDTDFDFDAILDAPYLHPQPNLAPYSHLCSTSNTLQTSGDIKEDILNITEQLTDLGFETIAFNYSRPRVPIKTAKVFVPGLCHIWPQLANERLYTVPVRLNWLRTANTENSLNPQALYI